MAFERALCKQMALDKLMLFSKVRGLGCGTGSGLVHTGGEEKVHLEESGFHYFSRINIRNNNFTSHMNIAKLI